jgi:serine/threonine-protein kinase
LAKSWNANRAAITSTAAPTQTGRGGALDGLLLSPDQIATAIGATEMAVTNRETAMGEESDYIADKACLPLNKAADGAVYGGSGWRAFRELRLVVPPGAKLTPIVNQAVVLFPSAHDAGAFFTASAEQWPACSNRQYTWTQYPQPESVYTVGPVSNTSGTLSASETSGGGNSPWPWTSCQRALTVANNVAIDVMACSHDRSDAQSNAAVNIAHQIAAKVPTT